MVCPSCKEETESGKFCTNCGASLANEEVAATSDSNPNLTAEVIAAETKQPATTENQSTNEALEKGKQVAGNFGNFFMTLLKNPSHAKKIDGKEWISGTITIALFILLFSISTFITLNNSYFGTTFVEGFLAPFLRLLILFAVIIALTFGGLKLAALKATITTTVAKAGAYLVPFLTIAVLGVLLAFIELPFAGTLILISLIAPILLIPTFIILEQPVNGFDSIYVLIGIYIVGMLIAGYLVQQMIFAFVGNITDLF
ncbi:zinc ribbon domain-containing protein [Oceanobacillus sp. FSL K6-2867]|uniref:zinc ribbon domain-containing protein n=1 Tax=Oceanobacillus sp. FSL K6-2867 TaxID=2954748 RepID=UPI0030DCED31